MNKYHKRSCNEHICALLQQLQLVVFCCIVVPLQLGVIAFALKLMKTEQQEKRACLAQQIPCFASYAGKSSLINALLLMKLLETGTIPMMDQVTIVSLSPPPPSLTKLSATKVQYYQLADAPLLQD